MLRVATLILALGVAGPLSADLYQFNVSMTGGQEVPPNASTGTGSAVVIFDDITGQMTVTGSYSGLSSNVAAAHVHGFAPAGVNAGVQFGLTHTGGTSGSLTGAGIFAGANIANVMNGLTYINVHTTIFPGGEVRGQLSNPLAIPEPASTLALGGLLALGIGAGRRRLR